MSVKRPDFVKAYEAVQVPRPLNLGRLQIGAPEEIADLFFESVERSLDLSPRTMAGFFEYETRDAGLSYQKTFQRIGGQAIASVLYLHREQRQRMFFAKMPLHQTTVETIRDLQILERLELGLE